jgi:NAD-dependent dihydropyrimidine dehydrogenase PreA subunit
VIFLTCRSSARRLASPRLQREQESIVAYVITDNCCKDELCIQACPVDCIHPRNDESGFDAATQVYVDPGECIDCGACIPVCPSDAIFPLDEVPADKQQFIAINAAHYGT